jgi:hypothetical protein
MEIEISVPSTQGSAISPYSELDKSSPHCPILFFKNHLISSAEQLLYFLSRLFPSGYPTSSSYSLMLCSMSLPHTVWPHHLSYLDHSINIWREVQIMCCVVILPNSKNTIDIPLVVSVRVLSIRSHAWEVLNFCAASKSVGLCPFMWRLLNLKTFCLMLIKFYMRSYNVTITVTVQLNLVYIYYLFSFFHNIFRPQSAIFRC